MCKQTHKYRENWWLHWEWKVGGKDRGRQLSCNKLLYIKYEQQDILNFIITLSGVYKL